MDEGNDKPGFRREFSMRFAFLDDSESHRVLVEAYFGDGISVFSECTDEFIDQDVLLID